VAKPMSSMQAQGVVKEMRVQEALREALRVPRHRTPTKPTKAARERRLSEKKRRGETKKLRRPPGD